MVHPAGDPIRAGSGDPGLRSVRAGDPRWRNLTAVLRAVEEMDRPTRAAVAAATGLTKAAVGNLVGRLVELGLLAESVQHTRGKGRPSAVLRIRRERFTVVIIDVGKTTCTVTVCDLTGAVLEQRITPTEFVAQSIEDERTALEAGAALAAELVTGSGTVLATVVAAHGVTDPVAGTLRRGGGYLDMAGAVRKQLGDRMWVVVENDANLAALGEWAHQPREIGSMVSLSGELSIGAGIILGGSLYRGDSGIAGAISHMVVDPAGPECGCGRRGCWYAHIGLGHVLRHGLPDQADTLAAAPGYASKAVHALDAAASSADPRAIRALAEAGRWLGVGAANIANILDPSRIIVGGYFPALAQWMMPAAKEAFAGRAVRVGDTDEVFRLSTLGVDQGHVGVGETEQRRIVAGGVHYASERLLSDPVTVARGW